jgi:DNA-binding CsgD family transcriptional regulator/tetratricopeptide (TPR) repeat protein
VPLFGRDQELRDVHALIAEAGEGGGALLVLGEAGIGKSSILAAATERAGELGMTVLAATGIEAETRLAFAGLHQLLRPVIGRIDALPPPQRNALLAAFGMTDEAAPDLFLTALATLEVLSDVAAETPVLVVADDAQWLDRATTDVLSFLARRLTSDPIVLLAALREGFESPLRDGSLTELLLDRLDRGASEEVLNAYAPSLPAAARARVLREAIGNPLALTELTETLETGDGDHGAFAEPSARLALTARLERAFSARARDLPEATQLLLLVAALNDGDEVTETLGAAAILGGGSAIDVNVEAMGPAILGQLIALEGNAIRFRHPLIRSAIAQAAGLTQRSAAHAALAEMLVDRPDSQIWHRAASSLGPDETIAIELEDAASRAERQGGVGVAISGLERAARLSTDPDRRGGRQLRAAELAFELGRDDIMARVLDEAGPLDGGPLEQRRQSWIRALSLRGPVTAMEAANIRSVIDAAERARDVGDLDLAIKLLGMTSERCRWIVADDQISSRVVEAAERLGLPASDPRLIQIQALTTLDRGKIVLEELSRHAREGTDDAIAARFLGTAALWVGALDLAAGFFAAAVSGLRAQGRLGLLTRALVCQAWVAVNLGTWSVAAPAADEGSRLAAETGQPFFAAWADQVRAMVAAARGDRAQAETLLEAVERDAAGFGAPSVMSSVEHGRGLASLAAGRYADAFSHLKRIFEPSDPAFHPVVRCWAIGDLIEAAVHSGHADEARPIVAELETVATRMPSPWLNLGLRYARAQLAVDEEAGDLFQVALRADLTHWPLARARLQLAYGSWLRRRRRVAEARVPLRAARDGFDRLGLVAEGERARVELRASGESSRTRSLDVFDQLTPQELQIAQLAAHGLSNRDIGQQLFLSHRTVGFHLYRIFPKLGITSRAQLAAILAREEVVVAEA